MPPFLPRKRLRSSTPEPDSSKSKGKGRAIESPRPRKPTLFDALDAGTSSKQAIQNTKTLLANLAGSDSDSELTSLSSSEPEFEDVPASKRQRIEKPTASDEDEDEEIEFEDVHAHVAHRAVVPPSYGDLDLTLTKETRISLVNPHNKKQGPSKIERQIRISTHCMHVQFLLWHNWIRNGWICDENVQQTLLEQLGPNVQKEIDRWKIDSGIIVNTHVEESSIKKKAKKGKKIDARSQRDWGEPAQRLASGSVNMSHGDPLFRLIRALSAYWKKRFRITAPGLRKVGYMSLATLDEELKSFSKDPHDLERHGERIRDIEEFRAAAKICEGSRDLSAQFFTALLRGLGLEARMVVSLQPVGFGWSKNEDAVEQPNRQDNTKEKKDYSTESGEDAENSGPKKQVSTAKKGRERKLKKDQKAKGMKAVRRGLRDSGTKGAPIDVSDSEATGTEEDTDNDSSIIDVTPTMPNKRPSKSYEKDTPPNYWVEVLSPITNSYYAVNPLNVSNPVATNSELLALLEPRGAKSEKAKQVISYVVGFSPDGTAKDVTVRYLKRHMWPGKTKGFRVPVEKVPIYNHKGKIKRYEEYDWFKTVISRYERSSTSRTDVDDHEEATDLRPVKPEKKTLKDGEETLQSYKSSAEFVLERHLRREEALLRTAKHVKFFTIKGKNGQPETEEKVFLRKDVVHCKSVETWHKEGREPKLGEQALKRVPYRAATTNRKRELAEAEAASGEKMLQGLYSWDQTDWIIPPPIVDGIIPKNAYGNMDVYVPSMVPVGAVHIPRRRTKEICRRLGIDYAEAVTGFEFGARMAVPVITGVVVAEENEEIVLEQWEKDEAERARKEDEKRTKAALGMWRKFLMGMRIVERVREEYGDDIDDSVDVLNPWINKKSNAQSSKKIGQMQRRIMDQHEEDMAGGFLPEGHYEEEPIQTFFPTRHDDDDNDDEGGGFIMEVDEQDGIQRGEETAYATPISMPSNKRTQLRPTSEEDEHIITTPQPNKGPSEAVRNINTYNQTKSKLLLARKRTVKSQGSTSKSRGKQLPAFDETDDDDNDASEDTDDSSLSSLNSSLDGSSAASLPPPSKPRARRSAQSSSQQKSSAKTKPQQRAVPKRQAARRSETALKSHYFDHSDDDDEE